MRKKQYKGKCRRMLPALLAAVLWIEGTFGAVYAAEPVPQTEQIVGTEEDNLSDKETVAETERTGTPEEENAASGETETPAKEENGENEESKENGETQAPGEETPEENEGSGETEEGRDSEGTENPIEEDASEDTVSENDMEQVEEESLEEFDPAGECALGEPPLMTGYEGGNSVYSYSSTDGVRSGEPVKRQTPSTVDIIQRYQDYPWSLKEKNTYSVDPSTKNPYKAGHLSNDSLVNALNLTNFIRYVAGVPADVTLNEEYTQMAQAGALVNCVNGKLSHEPTQPKGFPNDLYETGKKGCGKSNIAYNYGNIAQSLLNGWMYDGDSTNIASMGHRRWVLNPSMTQTGFGAVGAYSNMYSIDSEGAGISDFVAWPAQNMPIELMKGSGTPWTVSLGSDYGKADFQKVTVTLQDLSPNKNKTYTFSGTKAEGVFKVNTEGYGMPNCIIFRPNSISYSKTSQFRVTITGLANADGTNAEPLSYNVDFFSLSDKPAEVQEVKVSKDYLHFLKDEEGEQKETLFATIKPSNAADKTLTWTSAKPEVATVDDYGNVKAVGVGETTVSVTAGKAGKEKQDVCIVKVSDYTLSSTDDSFEADKETKIGKLSFDLTKDTASKKLTLLDGDSPATDSRDQIQWMSENDNVASVDDKGNVTPHAVGDTVIWVNVENGLTVLECKVKVEKSDVSDLEIRGWEENCTLRLRKDAEGNVIGDTGQLRVYFDQADTKWKRVKWESDNPSAVKLMLPQGNMEEEETEIVGEETTVLVKAVGAGSAKITAAIVDENGDPVKQGKGQAVCTVTVKEQAEAPEIGPADQPVALTNLQLTLGEVALPAGWSWKEPGTALAQFAGGKSKKLAAVYQPDTAENKLPAERFLEVYFLTVNGLSMEVQQGDEEISSLQSGQMAECYVNYFDEGTIQKFKDSEELAENRAYKGYKEQIEESIQWVSSNPKVAEVESVGNGVKLTAKEAGTTNLKAQLKLGKKTFSASRKITVTKAAGTLTVTAVEGFAPVSAAESVSDLAQKTYTGLLSGFKTEKANQVNSKIMLTLPGATKVTAKSNNAKVVAVKTSTVEGDGFAVSLIVKAAGTARITLTGNDEGKTSQEIVLVVDDAEPGLGEETVTVNTLKDTGEVITVYSAKSSLGEDYAVTDVKMGTDDKSKLFKLEPLSEETEEKAEAGMIHYMLKAKSGTKNGTYKVRLLATAAGMDFELPLTAKVVVAKPKCKVKQVSRLNLFYKKASSRLEIDTDGVDIDVDTENGKQGVELKGKAAANYYVDEVQEEAGKWYCYLRARENVILNSIKKGELSISLEGYTEPLTIPFTANVEKKAPKITWQSSKAVFYPNAGMTSVWVGVKNPENISWNEVSATLTAGGKNNYDSKVEVDRENGGFILKGSNLNQAETVKASISLQADSWTEPLLCKLTIQVSKGQPGIALTSKSLQLNANAAYKGYDAAAATVKWKDGGTLLVDSKDKSLRVSVYCDAKDTKAQALVQNSQVVFSVTRGPEEQTYQKYQIGVRLNNKDVASGAYKYIVQAAQNGNVWKTPLTLKIVNTTPDKAVKISAKGSIDVLNREGSFMTLTPSLKAVNGEFVTADDEKTPEDRTVKLTGRDAHLFRAKWDATETKIELRAKPNETLVTKYKYTVTPVIKIKNMTGDTEELTLSPVNFQVKQGSVKLTAAPKTALLYSGAYNSVEIDMNAVLKGADTPEIEKVTLVGNTDAFAYEYNKEERKGTLTMNRTGCAVKGKTYTLQFQVRLSEQADNVKPVTVRYTVKVK